MSPTCTPTATMATSSTPPPTASPRSRSTAPRCATPSAPGPSASLATPSIAPARTPRWASSSSPAPASGRSAPAANQRYRGPGGYLDEEGVPRLNVLDLQRQIRTLPLPVIAMVAGYAIGGGHVLHLVCDLTIAAENARFGQSGPKVGSFDAGYGATLLARIVGHKKAREIWFLCRQYSAQEALAMGLVNAVVPLERLEEETVQWCREILALSPTALRVLKAAFNADTDGLAGLQQLAGDATLLYYLSEEAKEGHAAYLERRAPTSPSSAASPSRPHAAGARGLPLPPPWRIWLLAARPATLPPPSLRCWSVARRHRRRRPPQRPLRRRPVRRPPPSRSPPTSPTTSSTSNAAPTGPAAWAPPASPRPASSRRRRCAGPPPSSSPRRPDRHLPDRGDRLARPRRRPPPPSPPASPTAAGPGPTATTAWATSSSSSSSASWP